MEPSTLREAIGLVLGDAETVLGSDRVAVVMSDDVASWAQLDSGNPHLLGSLQRQAASGSFGAAAWAYIPGGISSTGIVEVDEEPFADQVVRVAEAIQETVMEGHRDFGRSFPPCPVHRVHPLWPGVGEAGAEWFCLTDRDITVEIGCIQALPRQ